MALKKTNPKAGTTRKVTFELSAEAAAGAKEVRIAGDFNGWNTEDPATKMTKKKDGSFSKTLELEKGKEYQFRYCIDAGVRWENDDAADKYVPVNGLAVDNSVVDV